MKVLSLFDGISCGMVALERAGIIVEKYIAYEIDEAAIQISKKNYPQIEQRGDVTTADFTQYKNFDLLIGGSPCTFWSAAKNNRETTPDGIGGKLFLQYKRALDESECKYFLYENNNSIPRNIKEFISTQLGVQPLMINSNLVSAQNRERLYWTNIPNISAPKDKHIYLYDVIKKERKDLRPIGNWVHNTWGKKGKTPKLNMLYKLSAPKAHTLTTKKLHGMNYYLSEDKKMYSNLDADEWEILQTLPKGYTACAKEIDRYKCIGNGWTVDVIAHIFSGLKEV